NGISHVPGRFMGASHDEFKFSDGTVQIPPNADAQTMARNWLEVNYNDGAVLTVRTTPDLQSSIAHENLQVALSLCRQNPAFDCPHIKYQDRYYGLVPRDGRDWP